MTYDIIRTPGSLIDLRHLVESAICYGSKPLGAPFYDPNERQWCQAMTGLAATEGEVRLREPKRGK